TAYLRHLAHHPATARRIAEKLAVRFVADDPPRALVDRLAEVYLASGTDIATVLRTLVGSPEFRDTSTPKVRNPAEDVVATYRALGTKLRLAPAGRRDSSAANAMLWQAGRLGLQPLAWARPNGRPDRAEDWASTSRFLASLDLHHSMA